MIFKGWGSIQEWGSNRADTVNGLYGAHYGGKWVIIIEKKKVSSAALGTPVAKKSIRVLNIHVCTLLCGKRICIKNSIVYKIFRAIDALAFLEKTFPWARKLMNMPKLFSCFIASDALC